MFNTQVKITRDSVCMADDMQDNTKTLNIILPNEASTTIYNIAKEYLPTIVGQGHSWDCFLNGENVAVIDGNCVKITTLVSELHFTSESKLHFKYCSATS